MSGPSVFMFERGRVAHVFLCLREGRWLMCVRVQERLGGPCVFIQTTSVILPVYKTTLRLLQILLLTMDHSSVHIIRICIHINVFLFL